jgi:hypothetical protein
MIRRELKTHVAGAARSRPCSDDEVSELSKKEFKQVLFTSTMTALAIGLVFAAVFFLFTAFCVYVWL